jgi:hypothetical protein
MTSLIFLSIIIFLLGLYFYSKYNDPHYKEGLQNNDRDISCPNLLIQKDSKFFLYNSKLAKVPGVNPIEFNNLEEYVEFLDWQRSQGIKCPVLYLQRSYDTQGNSGYKVRPSVIEPKGGLPVSSPTQSITPEQSNSSNDTLLVDATHNDHPYNINSYPGFDQSSYYVGTKTPLDKMNEKAENMLYSPDAMDPNWGGPEYTQSLIDKGYYKGDNVSIYVGDN